LYTDKAEPRLRRYHERGKQESKRDVFESGSRPSLYLSVTSTALLQPFRVPQWSVLVSLSRTSKQTYPQREIEGEIGTQSRGTAHPSSSPVSHEPLARA